MTDDHDLNAAERALGHAPTGGEDASARAAREAWERRLAPMLASAPEVAPPDRLLARIEAEIGEDAANSAAVTTPSATPKAAPETFSGGLVGMGAEVIHLRRRLGVWKGVASVAMAAAAALAIYVAVPQEVQPADGAIGAKYVAVVTADEGGQTGLLIHFDTGTGVATVIPAGAKPPDGSSYEMWHLPEGATTPVSLGLLPQNAVARQTIVAGEGDLFAISLEPAGGSPTGQPTQAIYHGTVVRVE